jgi:hypothetical protein
MNVGRNAEIQKRRLRLETISFSLSGREGWRENLFQIGIED